MKDGRTHLTHEAEHAVDLETGAIVGVTVQDADEDDTTTSRETLIDAAEQIETVRPDDGLQKMVGDKGFTQRVAGGTRGCQCPPLYLRTRSRSPQLEEECRRP
jgi:hypothetical protein